MDASGRSVSRVVVDRDGSEEIYGADIVVVSCGAVNSAALMLRSASDKHPNGLANSSDVVGRHYMAHINSAVARDLEDAERHEVPEDPRPQRLLLGRRPAPSSRSGTSRCSASRDGNILRARAPRFVPGRVLDYLAGHTIDFWLTTEDLPRPDNRVTVDRAGNVHLAKTYRNTVPHQRLLAKLKDLLGPLGCHDMSIPRWSVLSQQIPIDGIAHQCGTVRFGTDPRRRRSTSTARRTTSTTSTSSTRASSRPRAR